MDIVNKSSERHKAVTALSMVKTVSEEVIDAGAQRVQLVTDVSPKKVVLTLLYIMLILVFLSVVGHALQFIFGRDHFVEYVRLFNLGDEKNIPTWYTSILLFINAGLLAYIARTLRKSGADYIRHWQGLSVIFALLSLDAIATIHDSTIEHPLVDLLQPSGFFLFPWVILGWIFVFVFGITYLRFFFNLPGSSRILFFVAASLYVGGALALEMVSAYLMDYYIDNTLLRGAVGTLQEFMEMLGLIVFSYALLLHIGRFVTPTAVAEAHHQTIPSKSSV